MTTDIIPLGTASAIPTRERHLPAVAVEREGRVYLFDCGEGTQLRLMEAGVSRARIDAIFISHLHGDHLYGLFGLLSTMGNLGRDEALYVVGPEPLEALVRGMPGLFEGSLPYELRFVAVDEESDEQLVYETEELTVTASALDHRVFSAGFRLEERERPGRLDPERARELGAEPVAHFSRLKAGEAVDVDGRTIEPEEVVGPPRPGVSFVYASDTQPCEATQALAAGADILYHEATFTHDMVERARETGHSTAREAAEVAREAGAKELLLGHISARYTTTDELVAEARAIFENTRAAEELKRYVLDPRAKWEE